MRSDLRPYVGRSVIVQVDDEHALAGTLSVETSTAITLTDAALLSDAGEATDMDGVILIERIRILWIQAL